MKVLFILLLLYYFPQYFRGSPPRIKTLHGVRNPALFYFAVPLYIYLHFEGCLSPKWLLKTPAIRITFQTQKGEEGFHNLLLNTLSTICKYYFYLYLIGQNLLSHLAPQKAGNRVFILVGYVPSEKKLKISLLHRENYNDTEIERGKKRFTFYLMDIFSSLSLSPLNKKDRICPLGSPLYVFLWCGMKGDSREE